MNTILSRHIKTSKITGEPVVILPLHIWKRLEDRMDDFEMAESKFLRSKIKKARSGKKLYSAIQIKNIFGIV